MCLYIPLKFIMSFHIHLNLILRKTLEVTPILQIKKENLSLNIQREEFKFECVSSHLSLGFFPTSLTDPKPEVYFPLPSYKI